jgi:hypothetical protein
MKKIYLHIGLPKTGTSYLQVTFAKNEIIYKKNGLLYPDLSNNHKLALEGRTTSGNASELAKRLNSSLKNHESNFDEVSFFKSLDPAYDYLISSEWLHNISSEDIEKMAQLVNQTHEVHLIIFYRSIPELINSGYLQQLKAGQVHSDFLDSLARLMESTRARIKNLISLCQSEIKHSVFNYNCCNDLIGVVDNLIFGKKVSIPFVAPEINPSPNLHQVNILRLIGDLGVSDFGLNMKYIEDSGGKSKGELLFNKALAESIESDFKDEIKALNEISFEGHQYLPFKNFKKPVVKASSLNFTPEDINHIKSSIQKSQIFNLKQSILWMNQFLGRHQQPSLPEDFDRISYLILNPDLVLNKAHPESHYLNFGKKEGRQYRKVVQKKILVIGHSHTVALAKAPSVSELFKFHDLNFDKGREEVSKINLDDYYLAKFLSIGGNVHNVLGLVNHPSSFDFYLPEAPEFPINPNARLLPVALVSSIIEKFVLQFFNMLPLATTILNKNFYQIESPPPIPCDTFIRENAIGFKEKIEQLGVSSAIFRYKFWRLHSMVVRKHCEKLGISFIEAPKESQDVNGFLLEKYWAKDAVHANALYGDLVLNQIHGIHQDTESKLS